MTYYLTYEQILELHDELLKRYGGLAGIRNENLLHSALEAPKAAMFGQEMYPSVYQKAAVYLYHIIQNHPFNDANKRTGFAVTLVFLEVNDIKIIFKKTDLEKLVIRVASGHVTKESIAHFLEFGNLD